MNANHWINLKPFMFTDHKRQDASSEAQAVIDLLKLKAGDRLLDLPCGIGRHAVPLAKKGIAVTAVDITQEFLWEAEDYAKMQDTTVEWVQGDMKLYSAPASYDAVINLYTSFGYFRDSADNLKVLENFYQSLKPGGKLLMDLMSLDLFHKMMPRQMYKKQDDGTLLISEHQFNEDQSWLENKWTLKSKTNRLDAKAGVRLYTRLELSDMLKQVGFKKLAVYGGFDGRSYNETAYHLVIVAEKPILSLT